jgi:hypothetical protein
MRQGTHNILLSAFVLALLCGAAYGQAKTQQRSIVVNGQSGTVQVIDTDGRLFVDLSALASVGKGSLSFAGQQIVVTFPGTTANPAAVHAEPPAAPEQQDNSAFSREFMKAGIEEIARLREWGSTLAYAIQNGYGVTEEWVNGYRDQAGQSLRLAEAAASTDADRNALQLLHNEFEAVQEWSNKLVAAKKSMDTAKYTMSPKALREDASSQKIITCGRFLAQMLGSGSFQDDPSCH